MNGNGEMPPSILGCFPQVLDDEEVSFVSGGCGKNSMKNYDVLLTYFRFHPCPCSIGGIAGSGEGIETMKRCLLLEEGVATVENSCVLTNGGHTGYHCCTVRRSWPWFCFVF